MRIDIQRYRDNTCVHCEKYDKTGRKLKSGQCIATKDDIYRCAKHKIFEFNMMRR